MHTNTFQKSTHEYAEGKNKMVLLGKLGSVYEGDQFSLHHEAFWNTGCKEQIALSKGSKTVHYNSKASISTF